MKNKLKYIIFGILFSGVLVSCSDWLDIKPTGEMIEEDYWKTGTDVKSVVASCYRSMLEDGFMERVVLGGELRSDNVINGRSLGNDQEYMKNVLSANILPSNPLAGWSSFYNVINKCNSVIHYAEDVMTLDPDYKSGEYRANMAEVMTLRALCYFYLIRIYKDVPFITEPTIDDTKDFKVAKSSDTEILQRITEDLELAEKYAVKEWTTLEETKGKVTKNAVRALLADIYLWQNRYEDCIAACDRILAEVYDQSIIDPVAASKVTSKTLMFLDPEGNLAFNTYSNIFYTGNSMESIFELQFNHIEKGNSKLFDYYGSPKAVGQLAAAPLDKWSTFPEKGNPAVITDTRATQSYWADQSSQEYYIYKYVKNPATITGTGNAYRSPDSGTPNWIFYRLPDIFTMKAEALVELSPDGDSGSEFRQEAIVLLNKTYKRANPDLGTDTLTVSQYPTQGEMRDLVLLERQREFLFEGKRWFDLLRMARREGSSSQMVSKYLLRKYSLTGNSAIVQNKFAIMDALYMPISTGELRVNPELVQNPYYLTVVEKDR